MSQFTKFLPFIDIERKNTNPIVILRLAPYALILELPVIASDSINIPGKAICFNYFHKQEVLRASCIENNPILCWDTHSKGRLDPKPSVGR